MSVQLPIRVDRTDRFYTVEVATSVHDLERIAVVINSSYKKVNEYLFH